MRTDFVLRGDQTNKHRVHSVVHKTMTVQNSIPFLRDPRNVSNQKFEAVVITDEK